MARSGKTTNSSGWNAIFSWIKYALTGKRDETKAVSQSSVSASSLVALNARLESLEKIIASGKFGDMKAESLDAPNVMIGGVPVGPGDHTHQVKINGSTKTIAKTGGTPVDLGTYLTQHQDISGKADVSAVVDSASYNSSDHTIVFKHGSTQLFTLDAAAFVKDGMVDSVAISNGNLVITFNTDAGKQPISISLTDIFNPNNYYTKTETNTLLGNKVDSTDSRLLPDADVFVATYTEQASGTTMEELETARTAGKKIYVNVGGAMSESGNTYEKMIPLTYVRYYDGNVTGYFFETVIDSFVSSSDSGKITTYWRAANGWGHTTSEVKYAETAGTANEATNAKGYVEGYGIALGLASKMSTTASNAATEALDNLMTKLGNYSSADAIDDLATIMAVSYNNGTNWKKLRPTTLWNYINSKASADGYATRPRIALLDVPKYYQDGSTVEYVTIYDKNTSVPTRQGYQILGNKANSSSNWGVCHVPTNVDYSKGYCEIEFDLQLWSYYWTGSAIEPYANLDLPYIINFVATTGSNDGASPSLISLNDSKIFATEALTIDCMRGTTASFAHVRLCGRLQSSTSANHAIYIGAQEANDWAALLVRAKMANVRIKYYDDVSSMT